MIFATYPSLADRTVLITGGASGIGAEMVQAFAANAARVAFLDIQEGVGRELAAKLAGTARHAPLFLPCDVTDTAALCAAIKTVGEQAGPVAVLVNNAGNDERHTIAAITPEYWDHTHNINLKHQFFAAQAVHPQMKSLGFGSIINFSSITWRSTI